MGECLVTISSDEDAKELMDKATQAMNVNLDRLKMGNSNYKQQFISKLLHKSSPLSCPSYAYEMTIARVPEQMPWR